jgi:hypothetical protein
VCRSVLTASTRSHRRDNPPGDLVALGESTFKPSATRHSGRPHRLVQPGLLRYDCDPVRSEIGLYTSARRDQQLARRRKRTLPCSVGSVKVVCPSTTALSDTPARGVVPSAHRQHAPTPPNAAGICGGIGTGMRRFRGGRDHRTSANTGETTNAYPQRPRTFLPAFAGLRLYSQTTRNIGANGSDRLSYAVFGAPVVSLRSQIKGRPGARRRLGLRSLALGPQMATAGGQRRAARRCACH